MRHATIPDARDRRLGYARRGAFHQVGGVLLVLSLLARGDVSVAEEPNSAAGRDASAVAPEGPASERANDPAPDPPGDPRIDPRKEQVVTVAVWLLAGVAFIGALLIGMIVLWGFRVRRLARAPLPKTARPDELWYLRSKAGLPPGGPTNSGPMNDARGQSADGDSAPGSGTSGT